jgi:hypothetical protein
LVTKALLNRVKSKKTHRYGPNPVRQRMIRQNGAFFALLNPAELIWPKKDWCCHEVRGPNEVNSLLKTKE